MFLDINQLWLKRSLLLKHISALKAVVFHRMEPPPLEPQVSVKRVSTKFSNNASLFLPQLQRNSKLQHQCRNMITMILPHQQRRRLSLHKCNKTKKERCTFTPPGNSPASCHICKRSEKCQPISLFKPGSFVQMAPVKSYGCLFILVFSLVSKTPETNLPILTEEQDEYTFKRQRPSHSQQHWKDQNTFMDAMSAAYPLFEISSIIIHHSFIHPCIH